MEISNRLKMCAERAVLLKILADCQEGAKVEAQGFIEAIPMLLKFLTSAEISTKIEPIVMRFDGLDGFWSFSRNLNKVGSFQEARVLMRWVEICAPRCLVAVFGRSVEIPENLDFEQQKFEEFGKEMVHFSDKLANLKGLATKSEEVEMVSRVLGIVEKSTFDAITATLEEAYSKIGKSELLNFRFLSLFISKGRNLRIQNSILLEKLVEWICKQTPTDPKWDRVAQRIFNDESHGVREYEAFVTAVLMKSEDLSQLERCFGSQLSHSKIFKRVVCVKLLFQKVLESKILRNVLDFVEKTGGESTIREVFEDAVKVWSNVAFIKCSTIQQQKHTTKMILYILHVSSQKPWNWSKYFYEISDGVQTRLSNPDVQIRQTGMFIGEIMSNLNFKNCEIPKNDEEKLPILKFDYREDDWIQEMRGIFENGINDEDIDVATSTFQEMLKIEEKPVKIEQTSAENALDSDDEDFPVYDVAESEKNVEKLGKNEEATKKAPPPKYILDCFENLLEKERYEVFEAALESLEPMIRRNAIGFPEIACRLAIRLIYMDDKFSTPEFEQKRNVAIIVCLVSRPQIVPNMVQIILNSDASMAHRYMILDAIRDAAKELGKPSEIMPKIAPISEISTTEAPTEASWKKVVDERIRAKTRRLTSIDNKSGAKFVENRLGKVANLFFYPLLIQSTGEHLELWGKDSALLAKIIFTISEIFISAGLSPKAPQMAISLIDYITPHRFSEDTFVRISVLFGFCAVVDMFPYTVLESLFQPLKISEWAKWASQVSTNSETNENEKKLADCLLTEIFRKTEGERENN